MGPVTNNPFLIAIINMIVVFGVLIVLGVLMHVIEMIDPTKKKAAPKAAAPVAAPAAAPVAAPVVEETKAELPLAPGSAGHVKLFDVPDKEAAMIMAIVAARAEAQTVQPFC